MTRSGDDDDDDTWGTTKKLLHIHTHTWEAGGVPTLPHGQSLVLYHNMYNGQLLGSHKISDFSHCLPVHLVFQLCVTVKIIHTHTQSIKGSLFPGSFLCIHARKCRYILLSNLN